MYVIVNIKKWNKPKESSRGCYIGLIIDYFVRSKYRHIDFILFLSVLHPSSGRPPRGRYSTLTHLGWTTLKGDIRWTFRLLHRVRGIFGTLHRLQTCASCLWTGWGVFCSLRHRSGRSGQRTIL